MSSGKEIEQAITDSYDMDPFPVICNTSGGSPAANNCVTPLRMDSNRYVVPIYGIVSPVLVLLTVVTNVFVCIVLLKRNMRSPTNMLLVAMAMSDMLTGVFPVPVFVFFYTFGRYVDVLPYDWCYLHSMLFMHLPTVCHTASIWLTVALSLQRYICVCHSQLAKKLCTIKNTVKAIVFIYVIAIVSQLSRFVEYRYFAIEVSSHSDPSGEKIVGCYSQFIPFVQDNLELVLSTYWWFRVIFIHLVPCTMLVILNALLFHAMRSAQRRRDLLLRQNRRNESRRLAESNLATLMLLAVIGVFLLVEFPLALLMLTMIYENTVKAQLMEKESRDLATHFINLCILFSYPVNFFIYCGMSRQFRETFKSLFACGKTVMTPVNVGQTFEMQTRLTCDNRNEL